MPIKKRATKPAIKKRAQKPVTVEVVHPTNDLSIRLGDHKLSPFVINLQKTVPTPEEIMEKGAIINLNLLQAVSPSIQKEQKQPENSLVLNYSDLIGQLQEEQLFSKQEHWILPKFSLLSSFPSLPSFSSKLGSHIPPDTFAPKPIPENIFDYFDIPEEEAEEVKEAGEAEESELVEINGTGVEINIEREPKRVSFWFSLRPIGAFILISFIFVLPLHAMNVVSQLRQTKTEVEDASKSAFSYLQQGADATLGNETEGADLAFSRASQNFSNAKQTISELGLGTSLLLSALPSTNKNFNSVNSLIKAGDELATAGSRMNEALDSLSKEVDPTPVSHIRILQSYLRSVLPHLTKANQELKKIKSDVIPENERKIFVETKNRLPALINSLSEFETLSGVATKILGENGTKRYLLVFQNNTEIRPTGGFMGSFAEIKVRDGILEQLNVPSGGTYDLQGSLTRSLVAPKPLQLLKARWEFQDANWFPDFPTSARQMMEFYNDAGGPSVDGVIAINATYVAKLIGLLGPIEMPNYDRVIDEENFIFETQKIVEVEYDKEENRPKQFIGDLAPKLIERALKSKPEIFLGLIDNLGNGLTQKDIQMYFADDSIQKVVLNNNWGGTILPTTGDYLMVVDTNLGGGKTDAAIKERVSLDVAIQKDGSTINTITVSRTHQGIPGLVFSGVNNVDYMRLYVPKGSELIYSSGFQIPNESLFEKPNQEWEIDDDLQFASIDERHDEKSGTDIYEENGKTVFGNWVQTAPGATTNVKFSYRVPEIMSGKNVSLLNQVKKFIGLQSTQSYSLTIQKQSGIIDRETSVSVSIPSELKTIWQSHDLSQTIFDNKTDGFFGALFEEIPDTTL
ncbi:DUF4012 domain-containing protein [Candidatus Uhrbacteria bacterium]|nr:DUF4012 domain-containing protein [Candidatus Uhrbacteria bacterium]